MKYIFLLVWLALLCTTAFALDEPFDKALEALLQEKIDNNNAIVEFSFDSKDKYIQISKKDNISKLEIMNFDPIGNAFKLKVIYNNGTSDEIIGRYQSFVEIPVASRIIRGGETVIASDLKYVKTRLTRVKGDLIMKESDVVGMQTKKYIASGSAFKSTDLQRPPAIKTGDPVNITYTKSNIYLKTSGIALSSGGIGENVKVKNEETGIVMLGEIINKNTIQISGE